MNDRMPDENTRTIEISFDPKDVAKSDEGLISLELAIGRLESIDAEIVFEARNRLYIALDALQKFGGVILPSGRIVTFQEILNTNGPKLKTQILKIAEKYIENDRYCIRKLHDLPINVKDRLGLLRLDHNFNTLIVLPAIDLQWLTINSRPEYKVAGNIVDYYFYGHLTENNRILETEQREDIGRYFLKYRIKQQLLSSPTEPVDPEES